MEVIYLDQQEYKIKEDCCVALGFFDGFHVGHMALIEEVYHCCQKTKLKRALLTFDQHPSVIFEHQSFSYLNTLEDKIEILEELGFDYLFVVTFNQTFANLSPKQFIDNYLKKIRASIVVCGYDFRFGKNQEGDFETLKQAGLIVSVIDKISYRNHKISSSYIRELLQDGEIELANLLLQYYYQVKGKVIYGRQNGRTIGCPTANVDYAPYLILKRGVYAVKFIHQRITYIGMANIGYNPTLGALNQLSLEVNIFDFDQMIYGDEVTVVFYKRIRDEKKFDDVSLLVEQLDHDRKEIKEYFEAYS